MTGRRVDRANAYPLSYAVTLGITTVVVTGLLIATGAYVEDQRSHTTERELSIIGATVVADLSAADRLAAASHNGTLVVTLNVPEQVSAGAYSMSLLTGGACRSDGPSTACLELRSSASGTVVALPFRNETRVANSSATGGRLNVAYMNRTLTIEDRR